MRYSKRMLMAVVNMCAAQATTACTSDTKIRRQASGWCIAVAAKVAVKVAGCG